MSHRYWKILTLIFVSLIILNPEMIELALFIDAVGLELFLMLISFQLRDISRLIFFSVSLQLKNMYHMLYMQINPAHLMSMMVILSLGSFTLL